MNTAFFVQAIFRDYVGVILGMIQDCSTWRLDPLEVGIINVVEFDQPLISAITGRQEL